MEYFLTKSSKKIFTQLVEKNNLLEIPLKNNLVKITLTFK